MTVFELKANQELRFNVADEQIRVELRRGLAEVYGTEMLLNKTYEFQRNSRAAIFTYHGAIIEMTGSPLKCHIGQKCDYMNYYLNIHADLEKMRDEAAIFSEQIKFNPNIAEGSQTVSNDSNNICNDSKEPTPVPKTSTSNSSIKPDLSKTPICLVCKPMYARNVGKSTLCRILSNYATRRGRAPIFVDLDPDQGHIGLPGTIGALSIEAPMDIETGMALRSSMLLHFGHSQPKTDNEDKSGLLYKALLESIARIVHSKLETDKKSYISGVIINTCAAWSDDKCWSDADYKIYYKILVHAAKVFEANMVLVMDDDILQDDLQKDLPNHVKVLNVPKTVGIITGKVEDIELRYKRIKEYFYGRPSESFNPMTSEIKFSLIKRLVYRVENPSMLPDALMPLGARAQDNQIRVTPYNGTASDLLHHILAISHCRIDDVLEDPDIVMRTNIMGFICITSVRGDGEILSVLTPQKMPSPMDHVLLYSTVRYMDSLI